MDSEQVIGVQRENIEHEILLDAENVECEVLLDTEQQEQNINIDAENVEQEILLDAEQQEQSINVDAENMTITYNLDYNDLTNKPTKLSDFTDDLGSSPTHTHSQYLTEHQDISGKQDVLSAGDGISLTGSTVSNTQSIEYIVGTQTAATNAWTGVSKDSTLKAGKIIAYYLPYAGTSAAATLQLTMADGTTTDAIELRRTVTSTVTTHFAAENVIILIYDGTYWKVSAYYDANTNYVPTGYCTTAAKTAAKSATCNYGYRDDPTYFPCVFRYANTANNATLAISSYATDALPIYVNGARTSSSNTFGRGVIMFLYYNNAYYCYNDGRFPIVFNGAVTSIQDVLASLQS